MSQNLLATTLSHNGESWEIRVGDHVVESISNRQEAWERFSAINARYTVARYRDHHQGT